jgi:hypothetical protein
MIKECRFCQQPLAKLYNQKDYGDNSENWDCTVCKVSFNYNLTETVHYYQIEYDKYIFRAWTEHAHAELTTADYQNILWWNYIPNITPQNIATKLKTYLLFL